MFLIFYVVYPTYNILYLINLNKKSVTHIWATAPAKVYHIDMDDVAIDVLINSDKDVIRTWVTDPHGSIPVTQIWARWRPTCN